MKENEATCKGSIMLGTGCGTCSRCKAEIESMRDKLSQKTKAGTDQREKLPAGAVGWLCPRCGRGNGPFASTCPCLPMPAPVITY